MVISNVDLFLTIIPSFLIAYLGIIILFHGRKSVTNIFFALISFCTVFWSIANYLSISSPDDQTLFWTRLVLFFAVPHALLFLLFVYNFPATKITNRKFLTILLSIMIITMLATVSPFVFSGINFVDGKTIPQTGILIPIFALVVLGSLFSALYLIIKKYLTANKDDKEHWRVMLIGTALSYIFIIATNFILVVFYQDTS